MSTIQLSQERWKQSEGGVFLTEMAGSDSRLSEQHVHAEALHGWPRANRAVTGVRRDRPLFDIARSSPL